MRIISIEQSSAPFNDGLADIKMRGLNRIVILAGANGSGKSRLLNRIQYGGNLAHYEKIWSNGYEFESMHGLAPINFVPKTIQLLDPANTTKMDFSQVVQQVIYPGMEQIAGSVLLYIQHIQDTWWNASHPLSKEEQSVRDFAGRNYQLLSELIQVVIGEPLARDLKGNARLFDQPIAQAQLSDGQVYLLQWCTALHAQEKRLSESILLMDEPENHLHPESMIETLDRIIEANKNGQIWIATHSVPLIAALYKNHSSDVSLYFMDKGTVSFASEQPDKVLNSLMGGESNIAALREFIDLPEVLAINRFATQCLLPPEVVSNISPNDPQIQIVASDIGSSESMLNMLDFGCGKGRLLESLFAKCGLNLSSQLDYVGWDNSDDNYECCQQVISKIYSNDKNRWFNDRQKFAKDYPGQQFDRIVLCNVFHEIDPTQWLNIFNEISIINQNLKESGELLIIEDYLMPQGEYAHQFGFIVLDTESLQKLFVAGDGKDKIRIQSERDGRIKGHFIPKPLLANVSAITIKQAVQLAQQNAKEKIEKIRTLKEHDFKSGRAHGFWVQQYANTTLALATY
jgi:ABC-type cobalamin/Fe3+-siderophores transport system ATPase subunit/cyclopropane fatty-acyl-phospholipid synthase-like methyltransferase